MKLALRWAALLAVVWSLCFGLEVGLEWLVYRRWHPVQSAVCCAFSTLYFVWAVRYEK